MKKASPKSNINITSYFYIYKYVVQTIFHFDCLNGMVNNIEYKSPKKAYALMLVYV